MPATILVIEDDRAFQNLLVRTLKNAGYEVAVASDGNQALDAVREHRPDLILIDLLLPKKDGRVVLRELRESSDTEETPVIAMSGVFRGRAAAREVEDLGAQGFLEKPFTTRELIANVKSLLTGDDSGQLPASAETQKISLAEKSGISVLWDAMSDRFTGAVQFQREKANKTLLLERGVPKLIRSNATQECLGRRLLSRGRIDMDTLKESLRQTKAHGLRQGQTLVRMGAVTQEEVDAELRAQGEDKLLDLFSWEDGEAWLMPGVKQMAFSTELAGWTPRQVIFHGVLRMTGARVLSRMSDMSGRQVFVRAERLAPEERDIPEIAGALAAMLQNPLVDSLLEEHGKALYALRCTGDATFFATTSSDAGGQAEPAVDNEKLLELKRLRGILKGQNHFERLQLEHDVMTGDVRKAFHKLAKEYHPDRHAGQPEAVRTVMAEIFTLLSAARDTLQDNELRRVYLSRLQSGRTEEEDREAVQRILSAEQKFKEAENAFKQRHYAQALALFKEIVVLQPDEAEFIAYLGWTHYLVNHKQPEAEDATKQYFEKALALVPESVTTLYFMGQFHKTCGRPAQAQRMFRKVLDLRPKHVEAARELRLLEMRKDKGTKSPGGGIFGIGRKKG